MGKKKFSKVFKKISKFRCFLSFRPLKLQPLEPGTKFGGRTKTLHTFYVVLAHKQNSKPSVVVVVEVVIREERRRWVRGCLDQAGAAVRR